MNQRGRRGPVPIRQQIINDIKDGIANGTLKPGQQLPPEPELMAKYDASSQTIRKTFRELREQGLITSRGRDGRFVGPPDVAPKRTQPWPFERIAATLAQEIRQGTPAPGQVLPAESHMMQQYGVGRTTVRRAVARLREQGFVFTVAAMGTFVADPDKWSDS